MDNLQEAPLDARSELTQPGKCIDAIDQTKPPRTY
jgi:hypothetical protein